MNCNLTAEVREKCQEHGYIHGRLNKDHAWSAEPLPPCYARGTHAVWPNLHPQAKLSTKSAGQKRPKPNAQLTRK